MPGPRLDGSTSYRSGPRDKWVEDVPHYERIVKAGVYPGIDWILHGSRGRLEYDFAVSAGADPSRIGLEFAGIDRLELLPSGDLALHAGPSVLMQKAPAAFQDLPAGRRTIRVSYRLEGARSVRFVLGEYDTSLPLMIDPVVESATWLGGRGEDSIAACDTECKLIAGSTSSIDFPAPAIGVRRGIDAYVQTDSSIVIIGGSGDDILTSYAESVVAGYTNSRDLQAPLFASPDLQVSYGGGDWDGFIGFLFSPGLYYLGGSGDDRILTISGRLDRFAAGGSTTSQDMPVWGAIQSRPGGGTDGFLMFRPGDASSGFSTYLGGPGEDRVTAVILPPSFPFANSDPVEAVAGGETDDPAWLGAGASRGGRDGFVARIRKPEDYSRIRDVTILGGSGHDAVTALCREPTGTIVAGGYTASADFAAGTAPAGHTVRNEDYFAARLTRDGQSASWLSVRGGSGNDRLLALACDGSAILAGGETTSRDLDVHRPLPDTAPAGPSDGFVTMWNSSGELAYSTYYGGNGTDRITAAGLLAEGSAVVAGVSDSSSLPFPPPGAQERPAGTNAFLATIAHPMIAAPIGMPVGKGLAGSLTVTLPARQENIGIPVTFESARPDLFQFALTQNGTLGARVENSLGIADRLTARMVTVSCLAASGEGTAKVTAPGFEPRSIRIRCTPPAVIAPAAATSGSILLVIGAVDEDTGTTYPQPVRAGSPAIAVHARSLDPENFPPFTADVLFSPDSPTERYLSFRVDSGPLRSDLELTSGSPVTFWPSSRIPLLGRPEEKTPDVWTPPFAPGLSAIVRYKGPRSGRVTFRSSDPARVRLWTVPQSTSEEVTAVYDSGRRELTPPVFAEAIDTGPVRITAFDGETATESPDLHVAPLTAALTQGSSAWYPSIAESSEVEVALTPFPLGSSLYYTAIVRSSLSIRIRSSNPDIIPLDTSVQFTPGRTKVPLRILSRTAGTATLRIEPDSAVPMITREIPVTVTAREPQLSDIVGKDLITPVTSVGSPARAISLDPDLLLVSSSSVAAGSESVSLRSSETVFGRALAAEGTARVAIQRSGIPDRIYTLSLRPSGFAWRRRSYTKGSFPPELAAWALDSQTLVPVASQSPRPDLAGSIQFRISGAGTARADPVPFGLIPVGVNIVGDGPVEIEIEQPGGFTTPAGSAPLRVRKETEKLLTVDTGVQLQSRFALPATGAVTLTSSDPSRLLLSTSATLPGAGSISYRGGDVYAQGLGTPGDVRVTVTRDGEQTLAAIVRVAPSAVIFERSYQSDTLELQANGSPRALPVTVATVTQAGRAGDEQVALRAGLEPVLVRLESSAPDVASVDQPVLLNSVISLGQASIRPQSSGTARISIVQPPGFSDISAQSSERTIVVRAPKLIVYPVAIPRNLRATVTFGIERDASVRPENVVISLRSKNPEKILLAASISEAATAEISIQSQEQGFFYVDALAGEGSAEIEISAPGFEGAVTRVELVPAAIVANHTQADTGVERASATIVIGPGNAMAQFLRPGADAVRLNYSSSDEKVFVPEPATGTITPGQTEPVWVPLKINGPGRALLRVTANGGIAPGEAEVVVVSRTIDMPASVTIGKDLVEKLRNPANAAMTATVSDSSAILISNGELTPGSQSVTIAAFGYLAIHALRGSGSARIDLTAPGFAPSSITVRLGPPQLVFEPRQLAPVVTPLSAPVRLIARLQSVADSPAAPLRPGAPPLSFRVESSAPEVGTLTPDPATIGPGQSSVTLDFRPRAEGITLLRLPVPPGFADPAAARTQAIPVTASRLSPARPLQVAYRMQRTASIFLNAPAVEPLAVTITSTAPDRVALAAIGSTVAVPSVTLTIPAGANGVTFSLAGLASSGRVPLTVTAPGVAAASFEAVLQPAAFVFDATPAPVAPGTTFLVAVRPTALDPVTLAPEQSTADGPLTLTPGQRFTLRTESSDSAIVEPRNPITVDPTTSSPAVSATARSGGFATLTLVQPEGFTEPSPRARVVVTVR